MLHPLRAGKILIPSALGALRHIAGCQPNVRRYHVRAGAWVGLTVRANTRFNGSAAPHRAFEARFHDLADFQRIKASVPSATINDVAVAYVGGTLRHYLEGHGELPDETLVAA